MADIATNVNGVVAADGSRSRCEWVGCSEDHLNSVSAKRGHYEYECTYFVRPCKLRDLPKPWRK